MIKNKVKSPKALKTLIAKLKKRHKKIVFTNGCFDMLHYGHAQYLESAKTHGDILIVGINSDRSVTGLKGSKRPIQGLADRMRIVAALESVDYVTHFGEETPAEIIGYLKPDLIVKGADYRLNDIVGKHIVEPYGGSVKKVKYLRGHSVTGLIKKIVKRYS